MWLEPMRCHTRLSFTRHSCDVITRPRLTQQRATASVQQTRVEHSQSSRADVRKDEASTAIGRTRLTRCCDELLYRSELCIELNVDERQREIPVCSTVISTNSPPCVVYVVRQYPYITLGGLIRVDNGEPASTEGRLLEAAQLSPIETGRIRKSTGEIDAQHEH
jgi:hypothetical protein